MEALFNIFMIITLIPIITITAGEIAYVFDLTDLSYYFRNLRKDHYLKQVFQNDPKYYKSSYRYFSQLLGN